MKVKCLAERPHRFSVPLSKVWKGGVVRCPGCGFNTYLQPKRDGFFSGLEMVLIYGGLIIVVGGIIAVFVLIGINGPQGDTDPGPDAGDPCSKPGQVYHDEDGNKLVCQD
ncbi:hypothetical protein [Streptomyces sp. NPDC015131]|uniref:hypothetical protein n=1 Tax=Streptomyces sp. NPDC015131 TaxID=3364941 RepID=UPI0036FA8EF3